MYARPQIICIIGYLNVRNTSEKLVLRTFVGAFIGFIVGFVVPKLLMQEIQKFKF